MSGMSAAKTRSEVVAMMRKIDISSSSNKHQRYSGGDPVGKKNNANRPIKTSGGSGC